MREVKGLIFSDIDGTLLDSKNQISERTRTRPRARRRNC